MHCTLTFLKKTVSDCCLLYHFFFQTQFCVLMCHGIVSLSVKCDYPLWMQYALIGYMISFLVLFSNFYIHAYFAKQHLKHKSSKASGKGVANGDINANEGMANGEVVMNGEVMANGVASVSLKQRKKHN